MNWEFTVLNWITENLHSDFWTPVLRFITTLGDGGILWIALALILLIPRRSRQCGFAMAPIASILRIVRQRHFEAFSRPDSSL